MRLARATETAGRGRSSRKTISKSQQPVSLLFSLKFLHWVFSLVLKSSDSTLLHSAFPVEGFYLCRTLDARTSILSPCFISLLFASSPLQAKATQACRWQIMTVLSPLASCVSKCMCVRVCAQCLFSSLPIVGCKAALGYLLAGCLGDWVTGWLTDWRAHSSLVYLLLIY